VNILLQPDALKRVASPKSGLILTGVRVIWSVLFRAMFILRDARAFDARGGLKNRRKAFRRCAAWAQIRLRE